LSSPRVPLPSTHRRPDEALRRVPVRVAIAALWLVSTSAIGADLDALAERLIQRFDDVEHVVPKTVAAWRSTGDDVVLLDVRSREEYAVSRLPGALHVAPGTSATETLGRIGDRVGGARVVAYCAVGQRSSVLAGDIEQTLIEAGAEGVYNLRGGIFAWHNAGRSLVDTQGETERIHPYSSRWARYLERRDRVAYSPRE
jgi:rhodanese-related sulfurtransferase